MATINKRAAGFGCYDDASAHGENSEIRASPSYGSAFCSETLRFVVCLPRGSDNEVSVGVNKPNN